MYLRSVEENRQLLSDRLYFFPFITSQNAFESICTPRTVNDVWHRLKGKGVFLAYVEVALHFTAEKL